MSPLLAMIAAAAQQRQGLPPQPPELTPDMQNTPAFAKMVSDYNAQNPLAAAPQAAPAPQQAPEPAQVTAPLPDAGPSVPVPASTAPAHHGGILGALKSVFMPEPDSLWAGALRNGIWNAKESQQAYKQGQTATALANQKTATDIQTAQQKLLKGDVVTAPTGAIIRLGPNGVEKLYEPPQKDDAKVSLIARWQQAKEAGDHQLMDVLERAIGGYQYTPGVIQQQGAARTATGVAIQHAKPKPVGRAAGGMKLPGGYIIQP